METFSLSHFALFAAAAASAAAETNLDTQRKVNKFILQEGEKRKRRRAREVEFLIRDGRKLQQR